jgi:hypothetical protein
VEYDLTALVDPEYRNKIKIDLSKGNSMDGFLEKLEYFRSETTGALKM